MASNLLKTFEKIERGRQKCIAKANEVDFPLPEDASLEKIAQCIDNQGHIDTYINEFKALIDNDFSRLRDVDTFRVPADIEAIADSALNNLNAKHIVLPENLVTVGASSCKNWVNFEGDLILPDTLTSIGNSAFYKIGYTNGCNVITIPNSVKSIGMDAFEANGAKIVNFDADVTAIPQSLCEVTSKDYARLEEFNISDELVNKITKVGGSAFKYQNKLKKGLPNFPNATELGSYAYAGCALNEKFVIPSTWPAKLSYYLFNGTQFNGGLEIENGTVTSTDENTFASALVNQPRLIIPENLRVFNNYCFQYLTGNHTFTANSKEWNGLERLDIMCDDIQLGYGMFSYAKIENLVIHASKFGYTNANGRYFQYTEYIKNIVLPNAPATPPYTNTIFYQGMFESIYVPDAYVNTYKTATSWKTAASRIKPLSQWSGYAEYLEEFGGAE